MAIFPLVQSFGEFKIIFSTPWIRKLIKKQTGKHRGRRDRS